MSYVFEWLKKMFAKPPRPEYRTIDGGVLCPHPGMTDDDLRDFETFFNIPTSFPK